LKGDLGEKYSICLALARRRTAKFLHSQKIVYP
jgi:hypothetical protein